MKRLVLLTSLAALAATLASASLAAAPRSAAVTIRHQTRGCHTWSLNRGPYKTAIDARLARGGSITVTNNDLMVQKLILTSGPPVLMSHVPHQHMMGPSMPRFTGRGVMKHMRESVKVTFSRPGVYRFTTEDLGDYMMLKTSGEDNHLFLIVHVS